MEIVKRVITEKTYDKNGKVVSEKTTEEHFKEKETIKSESITIPYTPPYIQPANPFDGNAWINSRPHHQGIETFCENKDYLWNSTERENLMDAVRFANTQIKYRQWLNKMES